MERGAATTTNGWTPPAGFVDPPRGENGTAASGGTCIAATDMGALKAAGNYGGGDWTNGPNSTTGNVVWTIALAPAPAGNPTAVVGYTTTEVVDATGSTPGGAGTLSYSWSQVSGTAVTLDTSTPGIATFERPSPLTVDIVLQVTVTESGGGSTAANVTIPADGTGGASHLVFDGTDWV
jgi:hypothetical protein